MEGRFDMDNNYFNMIDKNNIPKHVAIIMDGNGRWAKKRFLPRTFGHKAGVETLRDTLKACKEIGVKYLTVYAFSTENWNRPQEEVNALMELLWKYLKNEIKELHSNNVILNFIGDIQKLPERVRLELKNAVEETKNNDGITLSLALNYGSRNDIKNAIIGILNDFKDEKLSIEDISEETIRTYLTTRSIPDPDLLIRPSGELRLSNFMLWECAYTEFWFSSIYWPDFKRNDLYEAIYQYQNRDRRFGGVK